jgi:hypothetical protein
MEFRLGNQQRHSLVAVAMIAAATLIGLVLLDQRGADQQDPLAGLTETAETVVLGPARADDEYGPGRSSSRFDVAGDVDAAGDVETDNEAAKTLATLRRSSSTTRSTSPTTTATITAPPTTASTTKSTVTTTVTTSTTTSVVTTSTSTTSTTVATTTTTKKNKCRGKNPKCDDDRRGPED